MQFQSRHRDSTKTLSTNISIAPRSILVNRPGWLVLLLVVIAWLWPGIVVVERPHYSEARLFAQLDTSLKFGYASVDWGAA